MAKKLNILMVCSEVTPYATTGGLGDVCGALPTALAKRGHQVDVIMPFYQGTKLGGAVTELLGEPLAIHMDGNLVEGRLLAAKVDRPWRLLLVENAGFFGRESLYVDPDTGRDYPDNAARFAYFSKVVIEWMRRGAVKYDIVHAHDWQTALVMSYLRKWGDQSEFLAAPATLFTVHNAGFEGLFPPLEGRWFDLPSESFNMNELEFHGGWGLTKGGLVHADWDSTVSEHYAKEIQTEEYGFRLAGVFAARAERLTGIANGIDTEVWDPASDGALAQHYSTARLDGKKKCKTALLKEFGLSTEWVKKPVLGFIGRLTEQKGLDLIMPVAEDLIAHGFMMVFLGDSQERDTAERKSYKTQLLELAARFPEFVGVRIGFDDALAHRIQAGADMLLVPSKYEPCGLVQMCAQRYGTIPVVRAVGGLDDTVKGWSKGARGANGFKFTNYEPEALLKTLADAADLFEDQKRWRKLIDAAMEIDNSWDTRVAKYERLFQKIIKAKNEPPQPAQPEPMPESPAEG